MARQWATSDTLEPSETAAPHSARQNTPLSRGIDRTNIKEPPRLCRSLPGTSKRTLLTSRLQILSSHRRSHQPFRGCSCRDARRCAPSRMHAHTCRTYMRTSAQVVTTEGLPDLMISKGTEYPLVPKCILQLREEIFAKMSRAC